MEHNHRVSLCQRLPGDDEEWDRQGIQLGGWYVACECHRYWPVEMTRAGKPRGRDWWLCREGLCNLSGGLAKKYLARLERGLPLPEGVTPEACRVAEARDYARREHVRERGVSFWSREKIEERDRWAAMPEEEWQVRLEECSEAGEGRDSPATLPRTLTVRLDDMPTEEDIRLFRQLLHLTPGDNPVRLATPEGVVELPNSAMTADHADLIARVLSGARCTSHGGLEDEVWRV